MTILGTIVIGFLIGLIAAALRPGRGLGEFTIFSIVSIAGAILGRLIGRTIGLYVEGAAEGFIVSTIGAIVLILGYRYVTPPTSPEHA